MKKETGLSNIKTGNWIISGPIDLLVFLLPVWILWIVFFSNASFFENAQLPIWAWVVFILGIDVSHVWSSLYRTYLDKEEFQAQKRVLIFAPIIALGLSVVLLNISMLTFWRAMAYLAVFHFIKQQYGFIALYKLKAQDKVKWFISDKWMTYIATLYPVVYWHFNSESTFNWFVSNDFFQLHGLFANSQILSYVFTGLNVVYWLLIVAWVLHQVNAKRKGETVSTGKVLWMLTTAVNWWFGIVFFNSDVIFSISNVVAHGIPYLGLIYFYRLRKTEIKQQERSRLFQRLKWIGLLVLTVLIFAFVEEYFWDMLVYRDHFVFFESVYPYHWEQLTTGWPITIAIALLALPQQVHYIIDGFIWKMNAKNKYLKAIFKPNHES